MNIISKNYSSTEMYPGFKARNMFVCPSLPNEQKAHGPHRSPETQFKSVNTFGKRYDYSHYNTMLL